MGTVIEIRNKIVTFLSKPPTLFHGSKLVRDEWQHSALKSHYSWSSALMEHRCTDSGIQARISSRAGYRAINSRFDNKF